MPGGVIRKMGDGGGWLMRRKRNLRAGDLTAAAVFCLVLLALEAGAAAWAWEPNPYGHRHAGQCTWYAWQRWPQICRKPPCTGHACRWIIHARQKGYATGSRPAAGAIAVWDRKIGGAGHFGHVAYVESVISRDRFRVSEYNWPRGAGLRYREVTCRPGIHFIYPDGMPGFGGNAKRGGR